MHLQIIPYDLLITSDQIFLLHLNLCITIQAEGWDLCLGTSSRKELWESKTTFFQQLNEPGPGQTLI